MKKTLIYIASKIIFIGITCLTICLTEFTMKYISLPDNINIILKIIINTFASFGLTVIYTLLLLFIIEKLSKLLKY